MTLARTQLRLRRRAPGVFHENGTTVILTALDTELMADPEVITVTIDLGDTLNGPCPQDDVQDAKDHLFTRSEDL